MVASRSSTHDCQSGNSCGNFWLSALTWIFCSICSHTSARVNPPGAPDFCRRAQLLIGAGNKIDGFEVLAGPSDTLDVADILEQADHYDFTSGKDPQTQKVFFTARSKDRKIVIQFDVQGHRTIFSRVTYFY